MTVNNVKHENLSQWHSPFCRRRHGNNAKSILLLYNLMAIISELLHLKKENIA
jgi:hypothetical protein